MAIFWLPLLMGLPLLGGVIGGIAGWHNGFIRGLRSLCFTAVSAYAALAVTPTLATHLSASIAVDESPPFLSASPTLLAAARQLPEKLLSPAVFLAVFLLLRLLLPLLSGGDKRKSEKWHARLFGTLAGICANFFCGLILSATLAGLLFSVSFHPAVIRYEKRMASAGNFIPDNFSSTVFLRDFFINTPLSKLMAIRTGNAVYPLPEEASLVQRVIARADAWSVAEEKLSPFAEEFLRTASTSPLGQQILWEILQNIRDDGIDAYLTVQLKSDISERLLEEARLFLEESTKETAAEDLLLILNAYRLMEAYRLPEAEDPQTILLETDFLPDLLCLFHQNERFRPLKTASVDLLLTSLPLVEEPGFSVALSLISVAAENAERPEDVVLLLEVAASLTDLPVKKSVLACLGQYLYDAVLPTTP